MSRSLLICGVVLACLLAPPARADKVDKLMDLLIKKGVITQDEAKQLRSELDKPETSAPGAVTAKQSAIQIDGQFRLRPEGRRNADFNKAVGDNTLSTFQRLRLGMLYTGSAGTSAYVQLQDSRVWGAETAVTSDDGNLDLHQGYVNLTLRNGDWLRLGRQEMSYGDERLIGSFGWSNIGRSFDAARWGHNMKRGTLDVWAAQTRDADVPLLTGGARPNGSEAFYGAYVQWQRPGDAKLDTYLLYRDSSSPTFEHWTVGARTAGTITRRSIDYRAEAAYQFGDQYPQTFRAYAFDGELGYNFRNARKTRIGLEYAMASGDSSPNDNRVGTFDNLYPTNHNKYGYIDYVGWRNMRDLSTNLRWNTSKHARLTVASHKFWLAQAADAWYNAAGNPVMAADPTGASGKSLGTELDLMLDYTPGGPQSYEAGYSRFFPGSYVRNRQGVADASDWFYVQGLHNF